MNNAGIAGVNKPTHEIDAEDWQKEIEVNVNADFYCTNAAISHLQEAGGGSIDNPPSIHGRWSAHRVCHPIMPPRAPCG